MDDVFEKDAVAQRSYIILDDFSFIGERKQFGQAGQEILAISREKGLGQVVAPGQNGVVVPVIGVVQGRFVRELGLVGKDGRHGAAELFADAGAIINTPPDVSTVSLRVFELMRNFPETIAKCAETAAKIFNVK